METYYAINHHGKIYKTDATGTFLMKINGHPTNVKPIRFIDYKKCNSMIIGIALLMFFYFTGLAKSYAKNGGIASGAGRFFEPIILIYQR
jgi:F-type H+-transporting ATPase subunit a